MEEHFDYSNIKFRASSNGKLMTDPRTKEAKDKGELSETTKSYLLEKFIELKYQRRKDITSKYIEKGLAVEEDSITLYSRVEKVYYKKNETKLENEYITGTPDLFIGTSIENAEVIIDIKSSWDIWTFFKTKREKLNQDYYWQLQSYMALTGAKQARLVYCLVNTPPNLVYDEMNKLKWKMGVTDPDTDEHYKLACEALELQMNYDDIPLSERVHEISVERNDLDIARLYQRISDCRKYLANELFNQ